jgi:hypothetical protein
MVTEDASMLKNQKSVGGWQTNCCHGRGNDAAESNGSRSCQEVDHAA